jgi:hypothetical protein
MGLENYVVACNEFLLELKKSLTREDVDEPRTDCAGLGLVGWDQWEKKNFEEVAFYVLATPSERKKKKAWQENRHRRRLVLAAIHHVYRARAILNSLLEYDLQPGSTYREMASRGALAYLYAAFSDIPRWPFSGKDPFAD